MGVDMAAAARMAVEVVGAAVARTSLAAGTRVMATGTVETGITLVLAGTAAVYELDPDRDTVGAAS